MYRRQPNSKFILASSSSYRLALLKQIGLEPELVVAPNVDESELKGENPKDYVLRIAKAKLDAVVNKYSDCCILSADTIAVCRGKIIHKTDNADKAREALNSLSGRRHRVYTCVCLYSTSHESIRTDVSKTVVSFKCLSMEELECYLKSEEWKNKAGCYGIQGLASVFIRKIMGSFENIAGLPVNQLNSLLFWAGFGLKV